MLSTTRKAGVIKDPLSNKLPPLRVLPWWVALVGAVAVIASTAVTLRWLLPIAGHNPSLRIDAIKTGLSVGAAAGGAIALLLAVRRQRLGERTQAHAEEIALATQIHAEHVARDSTFDAAQRRVTELYGKVVEQIGHDKAAVRLGGLYSLERLAQDNPEHRQTVIYVICSYLRMPFSYSVESDDTSPVTDAPAPDDFNEMEFRLLAGGPGGRSA